MFCIFLLHIKGGGKSIHGITIEECKENCKKNCSVFPKSYILVTEPYKMIESTIQYATWNSSVPKEIIETWGKEEQNLYYQTKD